MTRVRSPRVPGGRRREHLRARGTIPKTGPAPYLTELLTYWSTYVARKRPKMPPRLRKLIYERDKFACQRCGWSPGIPDEYDGKNAIEVQVGTRRRLTRMSWTDQPDEYVDVPIYKALVIDHIHPYVMGGAFDDPNNLQALCSTCNGKKGAKI